LHYLQKELAKSYFLIENLLVMRDAVHLMVQNILVKQVILFFLIF